MIHRLVPLLMAAAAAGCSVIPERPPAPELYDLGPARASQQAPAIATPYFVTVEAPDWLQTSDIFYRSGAAGGTALARYRQHVWIASPAALLEARLASQLAGALPTNSPSPARRLVVTLENFEQRLIPQNRSQAFIRARASVLDPRTRLILGRRQFVLQEPAPANAAGAVAGLSAASDQLVAQMLDWLASLPAEPGP